MERWVEEVVRHPHVPLGGPTKDFYYRHTVRKDLQVRWDARPSCVRERSVADSSAHSRVAPPSFVLGTKPTPARSTVYDRSRVARS